MKELSKRNEFWIPKYRYLELKNFCLQYDSLAKEYQWLREHPEFTSQDITRPMGSNASFSDPTFNAVERLQKINNRMIMIERPMNFIDSQVHDILWAGVRSGISYDALILKFPRVCSRIQYYEEYRKYFWILDKIRN